MDSTVHFVDIRPRTMEPKNSIGAKWMRMLEAIDFATIVGGKRVAIKLHLGGSFGFTTVHPWFVRGLVNRVKGAGAADVFLTDSPGAVKSAAQRGYCEQTVGCRLEGVTGPEDKDYERVAVDPAFLDLDHLDLGAAVMKTDALIDLSHVKAHGDCGFGAAAKNLAMGCVTQKSRADLHKLEGGLVWDEEKCSKCYVCRENCPNGALSFKEDKFSVFYHHCKFCQHCVLICPENAIAMQGGRYVDFQKGLAIAVGKVLDNFDRANVLFINFLMNITLYCDCWGMSGPSIVPDIGIVASRDIAAIEQATCDMVKVENLLPSALPEAWEVGTEGHLFERLHRKSPFPVIEYLEQMGYGQRGYTVAETH